MRATINNYLQAERERREEGEKGFSLIELIIVVVILGILAAIAIPTFINIQANAETNALKASASNGASVAAAAYANGTAVSNSSFTSLNTDGVTVTLLSGSSLADFCVQAAKSGLTSQTSGPGCAAPADED